MVTYHWFLLYGYLSLVLVVMDWFLLSLVLAVMVTYHWFLLLWLLIIGSCTYHWFLLSLVLAVMATLAGLV